MKTNFPQTIRRWQDNLLRSLYKIDAPSDLYLLFLAALVGVFTGLGAYLLNLIVDGVHFLLFEQAGSGLIPESVLDYLRVLFPAVGGLTVGLLAYHLSPEVKGHGIPSVMDSVIAKGGLIRKRVTILTAINSGTTIGSGGSAGKEGPIVQIGAAIGSTLGQLLHVSQQRLRVLVGCGTAAGLAAVFNAPIAGVLFTVEIILADFSLAVFTPIVISSVIATSISHYLVGSTPLFAIPEYALHSPAEFPLYMLMGLLGGILSVIFIRTLYGIEDIFEEKISLPVWVKPAIGGLLTGGIAWYFPELYGFDDSATYSALTGHTAVYLLGVLMVAKILATSFSLGSGGTGGLFTPSLFIGATFGALFGNIAGIFFPDIVAAPGAYALVGMGVVVAGTIHAPLTALLIIFEVTTDYNIILPLMLATVTSTFIARWLEKESIYTMKMAQISSRHFSGGRSVDILQTHRIGSLVQTDAPVILAHTAFDEILNTLMHSRENSFPVVDEKRKLLGIISMRDLRPVLFDRELAPLLLADDIMRENVFVCLKDETLASALNKMEMVDTDLVPVVNNKEEMILEGTVSREQIIRRYRKENLLLTGQND